MEQKDETAVDPLHRLSQCGPHTDAGRLLRKFWNPVAVGDSVKALQARRLKVLGEELTLYRGESGAPHLVAGRCAHRLTQLHTGWVQGEEIRCIYHGWKYDGRGQCREAPAEGADFASKVRIAAYPLKEYCGLIFAYMGDGDPPPFELPRSRDFEKPDLIILAREQIWPCNWFQMVENSLDAVHVSFVHLAGKIGPFGEAVTATIPRLEYQETDWGIRQTATRGVGNVRISDWSFPNYNHIVTPGRRKDSPWVHRGVWNVPVDDLHTLKFGVYAMSSEGPAGDQDTLDHFARFGGYNPAEHEDELFEQKCWPEDPSLQLTPAQDYVAIRGQGALVDRARERLGKSDAGIVLLRRIFWREMDAIRNGKPTKRWSKADEAPELPMPQMKEGAEA